MVTELDNERAALVKAEQDLVEGERRITRQHILIERMRAEGRDVSFADDLLKVLSGQLQECYSHRDAILDRIRTIEKNLSGWGGGA